MNTSIEKARRIKPKARAVAEGCMNVAGVGLTKIGGSYAVKVNVREALSIPSVLPDRIDGVRIVYEVVGAVSLR